jgi:hypothetical protein
MLDGFQAAEVQTGETTIFVRRAGSGPPILLLHGFHLPSPHQPVDLGVPRSTL